MFLAIITQTKLLDYYPNLWTIISDFSQGTLVLCNNLMKFLKITSPCNCFSWCQTIGMNKLSRQLGTIPLNPQILILLQFESPDLESLYFESPLLWIPLPWIPRFWIPLPWVPRFWIPFTMNTQNRVLKNDSFFP